MSAHDAGMTIPAPALRGSGVILGIAVAVLLAAAVSFAAADAVDYPFLTVSWLYMIGVTQAGVVFTAIMRLVGAEWSKPYHRLAELSTLAFLPMAVLGLLLIAIGGRDELFYWLSADAHGHRSPWLSFDWLLIRNCAAQLLFYGVSLIYAVKALRLDLRPSTDERDRAALGELRVWSTLVIVAYAIAHTLLSWDFGMMLIEHWHSTVFPIYFSFGNLFAATAALILFPAILGRREAAVSPFGHEQIRNLGFVMTAFTLLWLYFFWAQFFVTWFGNLPWETAPIWRQMYGHYAPYFWTMMTLLFFLPFVAFIFAFIKRSLFALTVIAVGINVGVWLNKYLSIIPNMYPAHSPFGSGTDLLIALGLDAAFIAVLILLMRRLPVYARREMALRG